MSKFEKFPYGDTKRRIELQEQPVIVYNVMERAGLPSREEMRRRELAGKDAVIKNFKPLQREDCPNVIFGAPHGGELVPREIQNRLTSEGEETIVLTDLATPDIFRSEEIPGAEFMISRYITDPNRAPDFTPAGELAPGQIPGDILWKKGVRFGPLYKEGQEPTAEKIKEYAERFYLPYYNAMIGAIGTLLDRRKKPQERILVVDGHSFPVTNDMKPYFKHYGVSRPEGLPMFILGTRDGQSCDGDIAESFEEAIKKAFMSLSSAERELIGAGVKGGLVGRDAPFKGVHNVRFWGAREEGVNAIQVECNDGAYMDRPAGGVQREFRYNEEKISIIRQIIESASLDVNQLLKAK